MTSSSTKASNVQVASQGSNPEINVGELASAEEGDGKASKHVQLAHLNKKGSGA
jgi:hypothetical protein